VRRALLCAVFICSAARNGASQDRLSRLEWFFETGGSFLNLSKQPGEIPIYGTSNLGLLVSPNHFSSSPLYFTGLRYHLTAKNALEVAYSQSSANRVEVQPTTATMPLRYTFERYTWSFNYVRYLSGRGALQPFLTAGLGPIQSISVAGWDHTNLSVNFGMGTDFRINERLAFRLEVRDNVGFLPTPLRGSSQDLAPSAGLVFSPRTSTRAPAAFPQVEVFFEGGASVLTGGSGPLAGALMLNSNGQTSQPLNLIRTNMFSKSGRFLAGFRVVFSNNNALELSYSRGPNRYHEVQQWEPPLPGVVPLDTQITLAVVDLAANYVRYLPGGRSLKPFVTAG
jgi:hypothetical protein